MIEINFTDLKIREFGYVYKDLEKQAKLIEKKFGLPKIFISDVQDLPIIYRSNEKKIHIKIGISRIGDIELQFTQWVDGDCVYKEFIEQGKEGLHHFGAYVENLEEYVEEMKKRGYQPVQGGKFSRIIYNYFDTTDIFGVFFEIMELKKRKSRIRNK